MNETMQLTREERDADTTTLFGFWAYLMTDFVLFTSLFATFAVLRGSPATNAAFFDPPFVLIETVFLLASSFACGVALIIAGSGSRRGTLVWLTVTASLGLAFVSMEVSEFAKMIAAGNGPSTSGFLSSYFTLVGTHGLHVVIGLLWVCALMISILRRGLSRSNLRKLALFSFFWHFLDVVWIFIFTVVYLMPFV